MAPNEAPPVQTLNEFMLVSGENLPNHTASLAGLGKFVRSAYPTPITFRTRQQVYRFVAYLMTMSEALPNEDGAHTFDEVKTAIENL